MIAYVGQTRSAKLVRRLWELGIGECCARGELPPRRHPWFYDNGAFGDWRAGRPFDEPAFSADCEAIVRSGDRPRFLVVPDIVAAGAASLAYSASWLPRLAGLAPLYLAVQDGVDPSDVEPYVPLLRGIFVGGSLPWKIKTARAWVTFARYMGLQSHVGRVGTGRRIAWAKRIGADSIDSALPLWSEENLQVFLAALRGSGQLELGADRPL